MPFMVLFKPVEAPSLATAGYAKIRLSLKNLRSYNYYKKHSREGWEMSPNSAIKTLVIEDNPSDARLIQELLSEEKRASFVVDSAPTLADGLKLLEDDGYDIVILDLGLPDSSGINTFTITESQFPRMPIVVLTGLDDEELGAELVRKHAQDYLVKGQIDAQQLVRSLLFATERKKAEELSARLASIVRSSGEAIIGKTLDGFITSWNLGAERLYHYAEKDALGKPISIIVPPNRLQELHELMEKVRLGEEIENFETERITKDGNKIIVVLAISPIKDPAGHILGASTVVHDITERKIMEDKMKTVADTLQSALLPQTPKREDIDFGIVYHSSDPTGAKVGGDFYDFIRLDQNKIAVAVGDVSGKGLQTATTMAMVKYMLRAHLEEGVSPGDCLTRLNRSLYQAISEEMFITLFLIVIDTTAGTASYSSAGHTRPIICQPGLRPEALAAPIYIPLGLAPRYKFGSEEIDIRDISCLVLYTDGLVELRNSDGRTFGEKGIIETLPGALGEPAQELSESLLTGAARFAEGNIGDDIAILTIKPLIGRNSNAVAA